MWSGYDEIYENLLRQRCASGTQCHGVGSAMGGLLLADRDGAYEALLGGTGERPPRVVPYDPECSELMRRLASDDPAVQMPPGAPLMAAERCSVVRWIASGAER